ncbi:hypothetical protein PQX77_010857 [Marasmius sp. AFHP31]|nr:hypothetical protein PQX77_010857 [Marasmius sp. AFHP31]
MDKGEGYHLADWIIYHVFLNYPSLRWLFGSYDLWCIWIKNFLKRLEKNSEFFNDKDLLELLESVVGAIPQGHIDGHGDDCKKKYHYAYTKFVAMTIGELVETPWAVEKMTAAMTRQMNDGHRHDILDDFHGFWNWLKVQKLGLFLKLKWAKSGHKLLELTKPHEILTSSFESTVIAEWRALYAKPLPGPRDNNVEDLFVSRVAQKIPSFSSRISEQMTQEKVRLATRDGLDGVTDLLVTGINLDSKRRKLVHLASLKNPPKEKVKKLNAARVRLHKDALAFGEMMASYFPLLVPLLQSQAKEVDLDRPEHWDLPLPSTFSEKDRDTCGLRVAADIERSLREGQAHDYLEDVRTRILMNNHIIAVKKIDATGQRQHTRARALLRTQMNGARDSLRLYNYNRQCLVALGMDENNAVLKKLEEGELWCRSVSQARHLGSSSEPDPWYWSIGTQFGSDGESEEWKLEMHRVKWFRDRAVIDRWTEEKDILEAEYQRVITAHGRMEEIWTTMGGEYEMLSHAIKSADVVDTQHRNIMRGFQAYAHKQANVYARLKTDVIEQWSLKEKVKPPRKRKWSSDDHAELTEAEVKEEKEEQEWEDLDDWSYLDDEDSDGED